MKSLHILKDIIWDKMLIIKEITRMIKSNHGIIFEDYIMSIINIIFEYNLCIIYYMKIKYLKIILYQQYIILEYYEI